MPRRSRATAGVDTEGTKNSGRRLTAVGITCGIGSMLVGARQAGFDVVGNVEWRKYYHARDAEGRNTFEENFPGAFFRKSVDELTEDELALATGCDLAMGHPECGAYSQMQKCNNFRPTDSRRVSPSSPMDIPLFTQLVSRLRPRFFAMDDLPRSLDAYSMEDYARALPDYDLFPEWVSNFDYGNVQRMRRRMFMIGSRRDERWAFLPGEVAHGTLLRDVIGDLVLDPRTGDVPNHDRHTESEPAGRLLHMDRSWHRPTWRNGRAWFARAKEGATFMYHSPNAGGELKMKPGWYKQHWEGHCAVLDGGSGHIHPLRNLPFTIRERARIQGFPDDFVFYGTRINEAGEWNHELNIHMLKQTGKAMPVQFCRYVASQVRAAITGNDFQASGDRLLKPNEYIDLAKVWYCSEVGYSNQELACERCWMRDGCSIRPRPVGSGAGSALGLSDAGPVERVPPVDSISPEKPRSGRPRNRCRRPSIVAEVETRIIEFKGYNTQTVSVEKTNLVPGKVPGDYHCTCRFCRRAIGEILRPDGTYYSRLERRKYYDKIESGEGGHVAKTPLHVARWAIQEYTRVGDWVFDPTAGAGTTMVESLVQGRNAGGIELQFEEIISANLRLHAGGKRRAILGIGDARNVLGFLGETGMRYSLVVNNPPYSGDEHWTTYKVREDHPENTWSSTLDNYDRTMPNLAFLKENGEYWQTMESIYRGCLAGLLPGGKFVVAVKDQMRSKKPDQLHEKFAELLERIGLEFRGTVFLRHHPPTLHLSTYGKIHGVEPPKYQTIVVFQKR